MNTFLFAWNPNRWDWEDLQESIEHLKKVGYVERRWSCGNSKSIRKGDRVFFQYFIIRFFLNQTLFAFFLASFNKI